MPHTAAAALQWIGSERFGLTQQEAEQRVKQYGPNRLTLPRPDLRENLCCSGRGGIARRRQASLFWPPPTVLVTIFNRVL